MGDAIITIIVLCIVFGPAVCVGVVIGWIARGRSVAKALNPNSGRYSGVAPAVPVEPYVPVDEAPTYPPTHQALGKGDSPYEPYGT